ncbi:alcohol dehydrogenase GroES-like domain-containing protein [Hypoxylon trugodes]|uniref:alcohol dehydrogenase GroES-like domain-containing protein n=1 Tax=Hypoxylon trugodes TaxID=326681 RepID=UPI00219166CD|nr:alcohol dehydrogenase GroES-like domain-containing protein [Hypoxylon trugodes]KAI1391477.1 alcohol dehydrogenase GroES-like domain-containing protein [Hypoxylon trugodes]
MLPKTYKHAVFKGLNEPLTVEQTPLRLPGPGEILVKVEACGVCHTDHYAQINVLGSGFPRVPGHEIIGNVAAIGDNVMGWKVGDRIGAGYHGGHDGGCAQCKDGWPQMCDNLATNGISKDGGFGEYCILRAEASVHIPLDIDAKTCAPLLCAGSTIFHGLRISDLNPGDTVGVQGLGGLGHVAVQIAARMGYRVIAISRGPEKEAAARKLGAHEYIDSTNGDSGETLRALGGANLVISTAMSADVMTPLLKGLNILGKLLIVSFPGNITLDPITMINRGLSVQLCPIAKSADSEKTIEFASLHNLHCETETFPLDRAQDAFDAMLSGRVRFRAVLTM